MTNRSLVLCEGYHDRAFWAEMLLSRRWLDPGVQQGTGQRKPIQDPWDDNKKVQGGDFLFNRPAPSDVSVRVIPCMGKTKIIPRLRRCLAERSTRPVRSIIVCVDMDTDASEAPDLANGAHQAVQNVLQDPDFGMRLDSGGRFVLSDGTRIDVVAWRTNDGACLELPEKQTLERVICTAIHKTYPSRCPAVAAWLASRPEPPAANPHHKAMAWSHMAGWFADNGSEDFFRAIWRDRSIAGYLMELVRHMGLDALLCDLEV